MFDGKAFGQEVVRATKEYVARATGGLEDRIAKLEEKLLDARRQLAELEGRLTDGSLMRFEGVHSRGVNYQRGAVVVHGGTLWFCCRATSGTTPGGGDVWLLVVKHSEAISRPKAA